MEEKVLRGKFLVRKSKVKDGGKDVLLISGFFYPQNFDIETVNDNDEMWVSDITINTGGIRFTEPEGIDGGSLEDFLEAENGVQSPNYWKKKEDLYK